MDWKLSFHCPNCDLYSEYESEFPEDLENPQCDCGLKFKIEVKVEELKNAD